MPINNYGTLTVCQALYCTIPLFTLLRSICAKQPWSGCHDNLNAQTWKPRSQVLAQGLPIRSTEPGLSPCKVHIPAKCSMVSAHRAAERQV